MHRCAEKSPKKDEGEEDGDRVRDIQVDHPAEPLSRRVLHEPVVKGEQREARECCGRGEEQLRSHCNLQICSPLAHRYVVDVSVPAERLVSEEHRGGQPYGEDLGRTSDRVDMIEEQRGMHTIASMMNTSSNPNQLLTHNLVYNRAPTNSTAMETNTQFTTNSADPLVTGST